MARVAKFSGDSRVWVPETVMAGATQSFTEFSVQCELLAGVEAATTTTVEV